MTSLRASQRQDLLLLVVMSALLAGSATGQTTAARPDRGIMPVTSYSISDIERINLQNGNLNLSIPLASLPPIAGGKLSWTLHAFYNSKVWDTRVEERQDFPSGPVYPVSLPQLSQHGGWRIGGAYNLGSEPATNDYEYIPQTTDPEYQVLLQPWHKVTLQMPDGAIHELRPIDFSPYQGSHGYLTGYFEASPSNTGSAMRYYSFDGSYIWVKIYPPDSATGWEAYLPDGTKVVQMSSGIQRIIDTSGNSIKIFSDSVAGIWITHYQDEQTGREIKYAYDPAGNNNQGSAQVLYQTVGGGWAAIDINFGTTEVHGKLYEIQAPDCAYQEAIQSEHFTVLREIVFPQTEPGVPRQKYSFAYNSDTSDSTNVIWHYWCDQFSYTTLTTSPSHGWGSLSQMTTPQGATVNYSHSLNGIHTIYPVTASEETLLQKTVAHDGVVDNWSYGIGYDSGSVTAPDGSVTTETFYTHSSGYASSLGGSDGLAGMVYRTNQSGKVLTERHWIRKKFAGAHENAPYALLVFNPVVDAEYTSLLEGNPAQPVKMSARTFQHDYNGNVTQTTEYDWFDPLLVTRDFNGVPVGVPASATVLRITTNSHYNPATTSSSGNVYAKRSLSTGVPLILNAPKETIVGPSIVQLSYDGQAYGQPPVAGNLTSKSVWDDMHSTWITTSSTYGLFGNLATSTDARGNVTQFFYDDSTHSLPTSVVVDPENGTGQQTTSTVYDFSTGLVTRITDSNGKVSDIDYTNQLLGTVDPVARPGVAFGPVVNVGGVNQRRRVTTTYLDAARQVIVAADLNTENDKLLKTRTTSDMLGRTVLSEQSEDGVNYSISSRKVYEQMGRITYSSNPARTAPASTDGWTRVTNDTAGRVVEVATFGGAAQPSASPASSIPRWSGSVLTSYSGNKVQVTDQDHRSRRSEKDALGRLIEVVEFTRLLPDPSVVENPIAGDYTTSYKYDERGNLRKVAQGAQSRFFMYDSLSRLIRAKNPEQGNLMPDSDFPSLTDATSGTSNSDWSMAYSYDENDNLLKRKDARNITATYTYDALNRNTFINYSDTPTDPDITRGYDTAPNGKGRIRESYAGGNETLGTSVEHTRVHGYDALGRPADLRQRFKTNGTWSSEEYQTQRSYNLSGGTILQTYPSGRIVSYGYDGAGRLSSFNGNLGDDVTRPYSTGSIYSPLGGMTKEQFGTDTPIYNKSFYSSRGQLSEIRVSTSYTGPTDDDWNRGAIINHYSNNCWGMCSGPTDTMPDNNGNLKKQGVHIPGEPERWQQYEYDNLNRISWVREISGQELWKQTYAYDLYGNRRINTVLTSGFGINNLETEVETASNRLYAHGDLALPEPSRKIRYDGAGNQTKDYYSITGKNYDRTYDAENRMNSATRVGFSPSVYTYNADGQRVRRKIDGVETWQIYGLDGELLAEYAFNGAKANPQKEYGYRNGQLLVTATVGAGWGSPPELHDNPLDVGGTTVQSRHITELRTAINSLRTHLGLSPFVWQHPAESGDLIRADPVLEMRTALDEALGAPPPPGYSAGLGQTLPILAIHIQELRNRVLAAWISGSSVQISWLVTDQLGTPRMVIEKPGTLANVKRHDYLPFGEELVAGVGGRTTGQGYVGDNIRQKFTSKERDDETKLDYFLARYYSSTQGRFTSPDEFTGGPDELWVLGSGDEQKQALPYADISNPQSLNKYQYCYNNPLRYVDPDGHDVWESLKTFGQGVVGGAKEVANILMEGSPLVAVPNGVSKILTGKPLISPFEATNQAQRTGMTTAFVASVIAPTAGGKARALTKLGRGLSGVESGAIKSAKNILAEQLDTKTLQGAAREAIGEVVATKGSGLAYDHITKAKNGLQGLKNQEGLISRSLRDSNLSSKARASLQRNLSKIRTSIQRTQKFFKEHNIQ